MATTVATPVPGGVPYGLRKLIDGLLAAADALVFKGVRDCSANPNYPAADAGHVYRVSVAGKIGGGSGPNVEVGDLLICLTDGTAAGTHAAVGANWSIEQSNIDIDTDNTLAANSNAKVASQQAVKGYVDTATGLLIPKSIGDNLGDLIGFSADNTPVKIPKAGSDGKVSLSDAASTGGIKWGTIADLIGGPAVSVYTSSGFSLPNNTVTPITFDSEILDTDTMHDTSSNTTRITIRTPGLYLFIGRVVFSISGAGRRLAALAKNGTPITVQESPPFSGSVAAQAAVVTLLKLAVNDYIELDAFQSSGSAMTLASGATAGCEFMAVCLGKGT